MGRLVPQGLQELLARAAADETFREELLGDPAVAPGLTSQERMILRSITRHQLEVMIDRCKDLHVQRRQFLGTATASAITLLGGASLSAWGTACDRDPRSNPAYDQKEGPSGGIRSDMPGRAKAACHREVVVGEFRTLSGPGRSPGTVDVERLQDQVKRICGAIGVEPTTGLIRPSAMSGTAAARSPFDPIVDPRISICRKNTWRGSIFGKNPAVAPTVTIFSPHAQARTLASNTSPPT